MTVIDTLKEEHRLVRKYIDNLAIALDFVQEDLKVPKEVFEKTLEFSKTFLDQYHHFKEEYVLFLKLAEKKGGAIDPQIVTLRDQHERSRNFVKTIKASLDGYEAGEEAARATLAEHLGYYVLLQKQHLNRENHVFYPMARKAFSDEEMEEFQEEFKKQEDKLGADTFDKSKQLVEGIADLLKGKFGAQYRDKLDRIVDTHTH
ncbi:MAG: hypothetical protein GY866_24470 [Proteobacteria bacterium]|nr:hypothetical protein [Pseudomonadota bacterium]